MFDDFEKLFFYRHNLAAEAVIIQAAKISFCELTLVLNGTLDYAINGENITLKAGDALCLPVNAERFRKASGTAVDYVSFNYHSKSSPDFPIHCCDVISGEVRMLIKACDEIKKHYYENAYPMIFFIMQSILNITKANLETKKQPSMVLKIQKYIKENMSTKIFLENISELVSYSPAYCDTLFKKQTGYSINEYCINIKINEAKILIFEKELSLVKISEAVGYSDYNYFCRIFKKRTGFTPSEYRKKDYI